MTRAVEYTAGARDDLAAAVQWYEEAQPGLGVRFLDTVGATVAERNVSTNVRQFR